MKGLTSEQMATLAESTEKASRLFNPDFESEAKVRDHFVKVAEKKGIFQMKLEPPPKNIPDRLVLIRDRAYLVELKANNEAPRKAQAVFHQELVEKYGAVTQVYCLNSREAVDQFFNEEINE